MKQPQNDTGLMMNRGFDRSAQALSRMVKCPVNCIDTKIAALPGDFSLGRKAGSLIILTTEIIGHLSGKSYLIVTESDREKICSSVSGEMKMTDALQEALLLEIDNIVSAMVISQVADDLEVEAYGDVPKVHYLNAEELPPFLNAGAQDSPSNTILSATTFSIVGVDVQMRFIWKVSIKDLRTTKSTVNP